MKNTNTLRLFALVLALCVGSAAHGQLIYTSDAAAVPTFDAFKADGAFVSSTLLNLGSITSFTKNGLTFNLIPNLDPTPPSDLQVGGGFTADVKFLAESHADSDMFGGEQNLLGLGSQVLYNFGPASNTTWHISSLVPTDLVFWTQDNSFGLPVKFNMGDAQHFRTFTAADLNFTYFLFAIDDRGSQFVDYNDGVVGVRINNQAVGVVPVPEASTYGLIGAALMFCVVAFRRVCTKADAVG